MVKGNKELGIGVTGDISDITSKLDKLLDKIGLVKDKTVNLDVDVLDEEQVTNLQNSMDKLTDKTVKMDLGGDAESKVKDLTDKVNKLGSETETVKVDADITPAEGKINELRDQIEDLKGAAAGIVIGAGVTGSMEGAATRDEALAQIRAYMPESADEAERLATEIFKATGADWGEVADGLVQVKTQTGLTGNELESVTEKSIRFSRMFDEDVREVVRSATQLSQTFGISMSDAFDIMTKTFQATGDPADDLLDTFNEYDQNFKDMGYSAEEFGNILASGLKHGVMNTDQMADAIREAMIRLKTSPDEAKKVYDLIGASSEQQARWNKMLQAGGDQAQQAFEEIVGSISQIEDPLKRQEANVALFGSKFEDQGNGINQAIMDNTDYLNSMGTSFDTTSEKALSMGDTIKQALRSLPGGEWLSGILEGLWGFVTSDVGELITVGISGILGAIGSKLLGGEGAKSALDWGKGIGGKILEGIQGLLPKSVSDLIGKIFKGGGKGAGVGMIFTKEDLVGQEGSQTRTTWEEVFKGWGLSQEDLKKWNDSMNKGPLEDAKANTAALGQFITDSASTLSGVTTPITDTLNWLGESVEKWGSTAWDMITNFVGGLTGGLPDLDKTLDTLETKIQDTLNWLIELPSKAWQWGWDIIDSWKRGFGESLDGAKGWIEDKLSYLSGLLEGHSPPKEGPLSEIDVWGVNIGRSFVEGIGEGIG
ncbi:MAG TPA: phage tail tape measure protein, partial [Methanobacteriaceae archaeon]|nr:phage tail tape measure protein [Methanobacteriaceae archaeon]